MISVPGKEQLLDVTKALKRLQSEQFSREFKAIPIFYPNTRNPSACPGARLPPETRHTIY